MIEYAITAASLCLFNFYFYYRPNFEAISLNEQMSMYRNRTASETNNEKKQKPKTEASYVGCYSSENLFQNKVYAGDYIGANINAGIKHAVQNGRKYVAFAATGMGDGHAFGFSSFSKKGLSSKGDRPDVECDVPCDDEHSMSCGCADHGCAVEKLKGEESNRRWSVYQLGPSDSKNTKDALSATKKRKK